MFEPLPAKPNFPELEERVLKFWDEHDVFARSLELRKDCPRFVFYEGPPTANGTPHPGHCLTRAMKDLFPRYQTMCGKLVERKAGWDTHGLPVEVEVCKELGIHTKDEIESYGVEKFVQKCIESVFRYTREWEHMTRRLGFWVNLDEAYVTYHQSYVESVWWSLKTLFDRGLLYQGHKVVWWWAQGGTALSAGEVGEGYRTVDDPSVYVRFPLVDDTTETRRHGDTTADEHVSEPEALARDDAREAEAPAPREGEAPAEPRASARAVLREAQSSGKPVSLLVWTTTPWTLVSNHFAAVGPDKDYSLVYDKTTDEYFYIATALVSTTAEKIKHEFEKVATCKGSDLVGLRYVPPFDCYFEKRVLARERGWVEEPQPVDAPPSEAVPMKEKTAGQKDGGAAHIGWRVLAADFISLESGTGLVHEAPAFGEVDFDLLQQERGNFVDSDAIPVLCAVAPNGNFNDEAPEQYRGRWVKDCDKDIVRELKERGVLLHHEQIRHEYPFCPRAENDPLIQYARKSWFVRTSQFKDEFLKNNAKIKWLPDHIQEGRFGDFLRNNVDWALSRERYWGTPLPIWVCEKTGNMEAIGSYKELLAKPGVQGTDVWEAAKAANPDLPDHLRVHKPYIDAMMYDSPFADEQEGGCGTGVPPVPHRRDAGATETTKTPRMRRVTEVIDCWWDAGSMPFAQWGFPHVEGSAEMFAQRFPADFISEAIDQTRGWFYGLLAISTLLYSGSAMTHGLVAGQPAAIRRRAKKAVEKGWTSDETRAERENIADRLEHGFNLPAKPDPSEGLSGDEHLDNVTMTYPMPYRACIVLGHIMGEDGLKMSKRTRNYKDPDYIFDHFGADAMRWYFYAAQPPWTTARFQEANIRDAHREFLVRLYNVFSFFTIYANIDGFTGAPVSNRREGTGYKPVPQRSELDRWITSELHRTIRSVRESMDKFENFPAAGRMNEFVDALSNWYVRRSRERFWRSEKDQDKWDAYNTLHEVLVTLSKLIAPFTPFFAETMYQNLRGIKGTRDRGIEEKPLSVHLCDYPLADEALIDERLATEMDVVRQLVSLGRAARTAAKLKVRQPLALVEIILTRHEHEEWLQSHAELIGEELNIKKVEFATEADHYVTYRVAPNFKALGPKFGKLAPRIGNALKQIADAAAARKTLRSTGELPMTVDGVEVRLTSDELDIRLEARPGWSAAQGRAGVVVVKTELTPELKDEGLIRELIHHVQSLRKDEDLAYEARITLHVQADEALVDVIRRFEETVRAECLAEAIEFSPPSAGSVVVKKIDGRDVQLAVVAR